MYLYLSSEILLRCIACIAILSRTRVSCYFFFVNELRRVDNGEKNFCCDLGSPRQDMHPPFLHFCWGRNWLLPSWKRASCFATRIPWCVWMMACFSVTTMLYCYIEFQHRYFHCEEYCILHNGRHFLNVFPHANWTSSVCFSRFFFDFSFAAPIWKTGAYCGSHKPPKENLVPCAIYDTSFCRAFLKNASMAKQRFERGLFEFPFAFLVLSVLNTFCLFYHVSRKH